MHKLDEVDKQILRSLQEDCRISLKKMAKKVDVAVSTIHYRIERLQESGIISGYHAILDEDKLGYDFQTVIAVKGKHGPKYAGLGEKLANLPCVSAVYWLLGDIDYWLLTKARNRDEHLDALQELMDMEEIISTVTYVISKVILEKPTIEIHDDDD